MTKLPDSSSSDEEDDEDEDISTQITLINQLKYMLMFDEMKTRDKYGEISCNIPPNSCPNYKYICQILLFHKLLSLI